MFRRLPSGPKEERSHQPAGLVRAERVGPPSAGWRPSAPNEARRGVTGFGPFAETKGPRLPGRNPAIQEITLTRELGTQVRCVHLPTRFDWQTPRWIPDIQRQAVRAEP
ncbi:MAG: hypothetical protein ACQ9IQ_07235 [Nitrospirales bacterium]